MQKNHHLCNNDDTPLNNANHISHPRRFGELIYLWKDKHSQKGFAEIRYFVDASDVVNGSSSRSITISDDDRKLLLPSCNSSKIELFETDQIDEIQLIDLVEKITVLEERPPPSLKQAAAAPPLFMEQHQQFSSSSSPTRSSQPNQDPLSSTSGDHRHPINSHTIFI